MTLPDYHSGSSFSHRPNLGSHFWWHYSLRLKVLSLPCDSSTVYLHKGGSYCRNPRGTHGEAPTPLHKWVPTVDLTFEVEEEALL